MKDQYETLAKMYDNIVVENRDYQKISEELLGLIGERKHILDIGIGTGLVVEHMLKKAPLCQITGIDTSKDLLETAKGRLPASVKLYHQDVASLELSMKFTAAYSRGGAWTFIRKDNQILLLSHIFELEQLQQSFTRVAEHLEKNSILIISSTNAYRDTSVQTSDHSTYKRSSVFSTEGEQRFLSLHYSYSQKNQEAIKATLKLRSLDFELVKKMLHSSGLVFEHTSIDTYYVFKKI